MMTRPGHSPDQWEMMALLETDQSVIIRCSYDDDKWSPASCWYLDIFSSMSLSAANIIMWGYEESHQVAAQHSYTGLQPKHSTLSTSHDWNMLNDLTIGWQNLNLLNHPNATLALQARTSGENLNYVAPAPQWRQAMPSGEILNYSLSC